MVAVGTVEKLTPLKVVPKDVPPDGTVYQFMEVPGAVAFNVTVEPAHNGFGVAVTKLGALQHNCTLTVQTTELVQVPFVPVTV